MIVQQLSFTPSNWRENIATLNTEASIFLVFVSTKFNDIKEFLKSLQQQYPNTSIIGCSTAGEISDITVNDETISLTSIQLEKVSFKKVSVQIDNMADSYKVGQKFAAKLKSKDLKHLLVFSDGLNVNGANLVSGLKSKLSDVSITGGLAADGSDFKKTFVVNDDKVMDRTIVGVGFYGDNLKVGYSSKAGWDSFGIERLVTKSQYNILYELDGQPALKLYKSFLGEEAKNLPSSGLMFPLSMRDNETSMPLIRTILAVNEDEQSLTFAGNIPQGSYVRLMKANIDRLINGAEDSAIMANKGFQKKSELAILISCVGRRLVLKQMVEEEVEAVRNVLGTKPCITGFYSYGEIAPFGEFSPCELHNQTMTITTLSEC